MKINYPHDKIFIQTRLHNMSFGEFASKVSRIASWLKKNCAQDRLIGVLQNDPLQFILYYAGIRASGKIAVLMNHKLPVTTLAEQLNSINCSCILSDVVNFPNNFRILSISDSFDSDLIYELSDLDSPACVIFTSGSSGASKAIVHCERALINSAENQIIRLNITAYDKYLLSLPLYHVGGLSIFYRCLLSGATIIAASNFGNPFSDIEYFRPSHLSLVATQLQRIISQIKSPLSSLKAVLLGGSAISPDLKLAASENSLPCFYGYGSTETASAVCVTDSTFPIESSGCPFPDCEIKISDTGEILIKSPSLALGILSDGKISGIQDSNGYFHTRDCGNYSAKEGLIIFGRADRMYISGGENIFPEEIEHAILQIPNIDKAAVIAVADEEFGAVGAAFVRSSKPIVLNELQDALRDLLPNYKLPKYYFEFPSDYFENGIKLNRQYLENFLLEQGFRFQK